MKQPRTHKFAVGQVVRYIESGRFTTVAKIGSSGELYEGFLGPFITEMSRDRVRPLTKKERGPR